jgi:hypothetical protein
MKGSSAWLGSCSGALLLFLLVQAVFHSGSNWVLPGFDIAFRLLFLGSKAFLEMHLKKI